MILPGNSTEVPAALLSWDAMPETVFRFCCARSVYVNPCQSDSEATWWGLSSIAMSRAIRSVADLQVPKMTL